MSSRNCILSVFVLACCLLVAWTSQTNPSAAQQPNNPGPLAPWRYHLTVSSNGNILHLLDTQTGHVWYKLASREWEDWKVPAVGAEKK
jgi:hypothetical protein